MTTIFFSVGEPSGDLHAAGLMRALHATAPESKFRGFGGEQMVEQGLQQDFDLTQLAVVGFAEVLPKLREFFALKAQAKKIFATNKIDAVILVDFPGFNWHIAKEAKRVGIPVFYYLPPQLWAWGQWRIRKMKRTVDTVLSALPMEHAFFQAHGMDSEFVGHPFFEHVAQHELDQDWIAEKLADNPNRVAVLPGSRRKEVENIWPIQFEVISELAVRFPEVSFDVACLNEKHATLVRSMLAKSENAGLPIQLHVGKTSEVISVSRCVLMKSGSVSLELLARRKPANVVYHATRSTYAVATRLTDVRFMSLPNIIANKEIVPEFLAIGRSREIVPRLVDSMSRLIAEPAAREQQLDNLQSVYQQCGGTGASTRAAAVIVKKLEALGVGRKPHVSVLPDLKVG